MLHVVEFLATFAAALFAGAALYINIAEHPARMMLDTKSAALEWAPSYQRATWMQAPLALISLVTGVASWWLGGGVVWAIAGLLIGGVVPWTFLGIMPTNRLLLAPQRDLASPETRELLDKWAKLHAVRTMLSLLATALYIWQAAGI
ncbi:MAG TPA: DUF1772 domain-containing protein [Xanthobacteraceae bacterium]|jgi:hypothetical protein